MCPAGLISEGLVQVKFVAPGLLIHRQPPGLEPLMKPSKVNSAHVFIVSLLVGREPVRRILGRSHGGRTRGRRKETLSLIVTDLCV